MAVALAWLLRRSPNMLLIPGTSSVAHLRENVAGAGLQLPGDALTELDAIRAADAHGKVSSPPFAVSAHLASPGRVMPRIVDGTRIRPVHPRPAGPS